MEDVMKYIKRIAFVCAALSIIAFAPRAEAIDVGASAGVYVPMGDARDIYDVGWTANAHVGFGVVPMVDFRIFADYYTANGSLNGVGYSMESIGGGGMFVFSPPIPLIDPYVGAGYALRSVTHGPDHNQQRDLGHGPIVTAGINLSLLIVNIGLNASYVGNRVDGRELGGFTAGLGASIGF